MAQPIAIFHGFVDEHGKLTLDAPKSFQQAVRGLKNQAVDVTVKKRVNQRSLNQNAYIWGVAYPVIAEALGYDSHEREDLHYALVAKCFGEHFDKRIATMVPNKRSSTLSTKEFSEYIEWLVRFAATDLGGIVVPLPGESEAAA